MTGENEELKQEIEQSLDPPPPGDEILEAKIKNLRKKRVKAVKDPLNLTPAKKKKLTEFWQWILILGVLPLLDSIITAFQQVIDGQGWDWYIILNVLGYVIFPTALAAVKKSFDKEKEEYEDKLRTLDDEWYTKYAAKKNELYTLVATSKDELNAIRQTGALRDHDMDNFQARLSISEAKVVSTEALLHKEENTTNALRAELTALRAIK